jgi:hypothetical protein
MTFNVEVVLKGHDYAMTHECSVAHGAPATWDDGAVRDVLVEMLRAIDRAQNPETDVDRPVTLLGFSWIVEPSEGQVIIAIEIPMGAAVAGPFAIDQSELDARITRVLRAERYPGGTPTVH